MGAKLIRDLLLTISIMTNVFLFVKTAKHEHQLKETLSHVSEILDKQLKIFLH